MPPKKKITDLEVSEFLASFRERSQKEQEASSVFQELLLFPGWGMANVALKVKAPETNPEIPDPRKPPLERAKEMREHGQITDQGKGPAHPGSMTSASTNPQPNPWASTTPPRESGPVFLGMRTDVPPPFPGKWERLPDGWFRKE